MLITHTREEAFGEYLNRSLFLFTCCTCNALFDFDMIKLDQWSLTMLSTMLSICYFIDGYQITIWIHWLIHWLCTKSPFEKLILICTIMFLYVLAMCLCEVLLCVRHDDVHGHMYVWMFIGISTKMHCVFHEMRKWILANGIWRKKLSFQFSLDAWIRYSLSGCFRCYV